jgi:antirestriction protein ArdC
MRRPPKTPRTPAPGHDTRRTGARRSPKPSAQCENRPSHQTQYPRFHELAHALVRHDRQSDDPALDYAAEELVAESVAYTCVGALGVSTEDYSIPYLAAWAESSDLDVLERTAGLIDRLARRIEGAAIAEGGSADTDAATPDLLAVTA